MAIEGAVNNVIVTMKRRTVADLYNVIKMANMNPGHQINPADYVNIVGQVVGLPRSVCKRMDYKGFSTKDIRVGDTVIFSYLVVYSFNEGENGEAVHSNAFMYAGKEYWNVDIQNVFAVIRDGQIIMVNGYCMLQDVAPPTQIILLSDETKKVVQASKSFLSYIGNNLEGQKSIAAASGDDVYVDHRRVQHYKLFVETDTGQVEKPFAICRQKDIYGKKLGGYNPMNLIN